LANINQIFNFLKEFFKLDMTYLQATPIMDAFNKKNSDEDYNQLIKLQKQPISICVINQTTLHDQTALLLCYEEYALILIYNKALSSWQLQQSIIQPSALTAHSTGTISNKKSTSLSSLSSNLSTFSCLKWPRGSPPLQIEFNANNLYLFYNDSIITYKVNYDATDNLFLFKKSGVAFIYKPKHLCSHQNGNESYLTISNRRSVNGGGSSHQLTGDQQATADNNRPYYDYEGNEYNDDDLLNEDESQRPKSAADLDDNDRICLSYFCCP